jgi:integrase
MSVRRVERRDGAIAWKVRWRESGRGSRERSRTFDRKADAVAFDDELRRRRRLGELALLVGSRETLDRYVAETWARTHAITLAPKTAKHYASLYDLHVSPFLGDLKLMELTPEVIARWQAERVAAGARHVAVLQALDLLGSILQRAVEAGRLSRNPVRLVRRIRRPRRREVRPLAPVTVEAMRQASGARDAALISVLAYAGLRPQEALALAWADVRERTLLIERAASLGHEKDTKTQAHGRSGSSRHSVRIFSGGGSGPVVPPMVRCSSLARKAGCGRRRRMTTGATVPLPARVRLPPPRARRRTRCATALRACYFTRVAASSTSHVSSATTRGSR